MLCKLGIDVAITVHTSSRPTTYNYSIGFHDRLPQEVNILVERDNNDEFNDELQVEEEQPEEQTEEQNEQQNEQQVEEQQ